MKKILLVVFTATLFSILSMSTLGQTPKRINFVRGTHETVVTGTLNGYKSSKTFLVRVGKGQMLTTENVGDNSITITIEAPRGSTYEQDMAADCHDRNEVTPTAAGDYRITVTECLKADAWKGKFKFKVVAR